MVGALPSVLSKGSNRGGGAFHNSIIGEFMVYQDRLERNLLQLFGHPRKFRMIFYNFCYYF